MNTKCIHIIYEHKMYTLINEHKMYTILMNTKCIHWFYAEFIIHTIRYMGVNSFLHKVHTFSKWAL